MNNVQKILFSGMILLTVFWGNRFNNADWASESSRNNPAKFSALETSSFLAQSIGAVGPASQTSSSTGSVSPSEANVSGAQIGGNLTNDMNKKNVPEPRADASSSPPPEIGLPPPPEGSNIQAGDGLRTHSQRCGEIPVWGAGCGGLLSSATAPAAPIFYRYKNDLAPSVSAQEALVADLQSGETYLDTNTDTRWPLASLTKLMTAVMVMKHVDLKGRLTLAPADFVGGEETDFFKTGSAYSASDVLTTMLLLSKNEAAEALANAFGREKFIDGLNEIAAEWGMQRTHFADPTGLSIADQSTPQDLEKLALHLYQNYPKILETTRRKSAAIAELGSGKKTTISNINLFAGRSDFLGGKTGYTDEASGNLLSIFSYERRPVLIIVLGTNDRFAETEKLFNWFKNNFHANK